MMLFTSVVDRVIFSIKHPKAKVVMLEILEA